MYPGTNSHFYLPSPNLWFAFGQETPNSSTIKTRKQNRNIPFMCCEAANHSPRAHFQCLRNPSPVSYYFVNYPLQEFQWNSPHDVEAVPSEKSMVATCQPQATADKKAYENSSSAFDQVEASLCFFFCCCFCFNVCMCLFKYMHVKYCVNAPSLSGC